MNGEAGAYKTGFIECWRRVRMKAGDPIILELRTYGVIEPMVTLSVD